MITNWVKRWKDGRTDTVVLGPNSIDFSKGTISVTVSKTERTVLKDSTTIYDTIFPDSGFLRQYPNCIDTVCYSKNGHEYIGILYPSSATGVDKLPPFGLYFGLYDVTAGGWAAKHIPIAASFSYTNKVAIEYNSAGNLWAVYHNGTNTYIVQRFSADGVSWTAESNITAVTNVPVTTYQENELPDIKWVGKWDRSYAPTQGTYIRAFGSYHMVSRKASSAGKSYAKFKVTGMNLYMYCYGSHKKGYCGRTSIYIDGIRHRTVNLAKYPGYRNRIKLNATPLSDTEHTVVLKHLTGSVFCLDAVEAFRSSNTFILNDIVSKRGGSSSDDIVAYTRITNDPSGIKQATIMLCNRNAQEFKPDHYGPGTSTIRFMEDGYGLWAFLTGKMNGSTGIEHYLHPGHSDVTETAVDYSASAWGSPVFIRNIPGYSNASVASANDSTFSIYCGTVPQSSTTEYLRESTVVALTNNPHFPAVEFPVNDGSGTYIHHTFSFSDVHAGGSVGLFFVNKDGNPGWIDVTKNSMSVRVDDIDEWVSDISIEHDDTSNPSTMQIVMNDAEKLFSENSQLYKMYDILPHTFEDNSPRLIIADVRFDQGPFYYESRVFTGMVGSIDESYQREGHRITISCFDYAKWLQLFNSPKYEVYASPTLAWAENAGDYPIYFDDGEAIPQILRSVIKWKIKDVTGKEQNIIAGWDTSNSYLPGNFAVDTVEGVIVQNDYGFMVSPEMSIGAHIATADFTTPNSVDFKASIGLQVYGWNSALHDMAAGTLLELNMPGRSISLKSRENGVVGSAWVTRSSVPFIFQPNTRYRMNAYVSAAGVSVTVRDVENRSMYKSLSYSHASGYKYHTSVMTIGHEVFGQTMKWDNISVRDNSAPLKEDVDVALSVVASAFQGIIPLNKKEYSSGDYFTAAVIQPDDTAHDSVSWVALQNGKHWYFGYDGTFEWVSSMVLSTVFSIGDLDLEDVSVSFDPQSYVNWVEVVGETEKREDGSADAPMRVSVFDGDSNSMLMNGIHYKQVSINGSPTKEQATKTGLSHMYDSKASREEWDVALSSPMVFLQPRDCIYVSSSRIREMSQGKALYIQSVSMKASDSKPITVSMKLTSKYAAQMSSAVRIMNSQSTMEAD